MKAVVVREFGGPDALVWEDRPQPVPGPGEVLVRVLAVGLAWSDLLQAEGSYHGGGPEPPFIPGWELVGEVAGHGPGARAPDLGARVCGFLRAPAALADFVAAPAAVLDPAPAWLSDADAAAFVVPFLTADAAMVTVGRLQENEAVLVHAAAGGVGAAAVQLARALGASPIIATAGSESRRAAADELGADLVAGYDDFPDVVREATGGRGADLVLESVGGDVFDRSLHALAPLGRLVSIGASSGQRPDKLRLPVLWHGAVSVAGVHIARWLNDTPELPGAFAASRPRPARGTGDRADRWRDLSGCTRRRRVSSAPIAKRGRTGDRHHGRERCVRISSADGTELALRRRGSGQPLVLVHGSACDSTCWASLADRLEPDFELLMLDRRGHGGSGTGQSPYSLDREAEDILVALEIAGPRPILFAHSWGARCAVQALALGASPAAAMLYEPLDSTYRPYDRATLERFARLERVGPTEEALRFYFGRMAGVPAELLDAMADGEEWSMAEAALGTLAREARAWFDAPIDAAALSGVELPVRLLLGGRSPEPYTQAAETLAGALPDADITVLDGQGHVAHLRDPGAVAALVRQLVEELKERERC